MTRALAIAIGLCGVRGPMPWEYHRGGERTIGSSAITTPKKAMTSTQGRREHDRRTPARRLACGER
jgi:hypothetical protein